MAELLLPTPQQSNCTQRGWTGHTTAQGTPRAHRAHLLLDLVHGPRHRPRRGGGVPAIVLLDGRGEAAHDQLARLRPVHVGEDTAGNLRQEDDEHDGNVLQGGREGRGDAYGVVSLTGYTHQDEENAVKLLLARAPDDPEYRDDHDGRSHGDEQVGADQEDAVLHRLHDDLVHYFQPHPHAQQRQPTDLRAEEGGEYMHTSPSWATLARWRNLPRREPAK